MRWLLSNYNFPAARAEALRQAQVQDGPHAFGLITTLVRNEPKSHATLTQAEVDEYNQAIFKELSTLYWFIDEYLASGDLSADDPRLVLPEQRALDIMLISNRGETDRELVRWVKIAQLFLDKYSARVREGLSPDGILQDLNRQLCITQNGDTQLTAAQAFKQKRVVAHRHHYNSNGEGHFADYNPLNIVLRNAEANMAQKTCSLHFWRYPCQCPLVPSEPEEGRCHPRCHVLTEDFFELNVQIELVSIGSGLYPTLGEVDIRRKIREAFRRHCAEHDYTGHEYLSDDNEENLLTARYERFENLRERFDVNAPGDGTYCTRQQTNVTLDEILNGIKDIPRGLLRNLEQQAQQLRPLTEPRISDETADQSRLLYGGIDRESVRVLNHRTLTRAVAMIDLLRMITVGDFITDHEGLTDEEKDADVLLHNGKLGTKGEAQVLEFTHPNHNDGQRFHHTLPRALKMLQLYIDHCRHWKITPNDDFPNLAKFVRFFSVLSPVGDALPQQLAAAQELQASHTHHLRSTKDARCVNPRHMWVESKWLNMLHGICSLIPEIPCKGQCKCHPTQGQDCLPCFFKLTDERLYDDALTQCQLGESGRFGSVDFDTALRKVASDWREIFRNSEHNEPDFLSFVLNHGSLPVRYCGTCREEFRLQRLANNHRCNENEQEEDAAAVVKPQKNMGQILKDDGLMREVLDAILKWGLTGNVGRGSRGSTWTFVGKQLSFTPAHRHALRRLITDSRFQDYCATLDPPLTIVGEEGNRLLVCDGSRNGCPCDLHGDQVD